MNPKVTGGRHEGRSSGWLANSMVDGRGGECPWGALDVCHIRIRVRWTFEVRTILIKPVNDALHGQVRIPVVVTCLSLSVGVLCFKPLHESILPNLIMSSLNILINGPRLLNSLSAYLQSVFIDGH
jgi:hypothetical protein